MKRVLEVLYGFGYGGIRACIQNYVTYINHAEFQIDIYAYGITESPFKTQFEAMGCNVYLDRENYIATNNIVGFVDKLTKYIQNGRYDVVHAHCNLISAWITLAAKRAGVHVRISHSHATNHLNYNSFKQRCWCYLRRWIISHTATVQLACGEKAGYAMYGNNQFIVLKNGIDVRRFATINYERVRTLKAEFGIAENSKVYMNMTRFDHNKNHLFILEIAKIIHEKEPEAKFILGGNFPYIDSSFDEVKAKVNEYHLNNCVILSGPRMDIADMYHLSDCWIFPSKNEGLPFGPIELQAASIPCLTSDTVTTEIDLGLGLIEFMSLKESPEAWANKAMSMSKSHIPFEITLKAFQDHDFDITINVKKLEAIYRGELTI